MDVPSNGFGFLKNLNVFSNDEKMQYGFMYLEGFSLVTSKPQLPGKFMSVIELISE